MPTARAASSGIAPHRIVAAFVAKAPELLEDPDQRQPLTRRLGLVRRQNPVQFVLPRTELRQRLNRALVINAVAPLRSTFRTTFRDTLSSRQIALIDFP